jgi:arylsulfatase A-like enzyme
MAHDSALFSDKGGSATGRSHHEAGFGVISEIATAYPGYDAVMPDTGVTLGTIMRDNGYNTSWFGKNHNMPDYETSQAGPFKSPVPAVRAPA